MSRKLEIVSRNPSVPSLDARYCEVARRDPREFSFGYLAADGATGAVGPFLWFADLGELVRFVATTELGLLRLSPILHVGVTDALAATVRRERDVARLPLAFTAAFCGWTEFLWVGRFADLCEADGPVPAGLRAELRSTPHGCGSDDPLRPDEVPALVALLSAQAESCCGAGADGASQAAEVARPASAKRRSG